MECGPDPTLSSGSLALIYLFELKFKRQQFPHFTTQASSSSIFVELKLFHLKVITEILNVSITRYPRKETLS